MQNKRNFVGRSLQFSQNLMRTFLKQPRRGASRAHILQRQPVSCHVEYLEDRTLLSAAFPEFANPHPSDVTRFGDSVVTLTTGNVVITDLDGAKVWTYPYHPRAFITALAFSPKGDVILSSSYDDGVKGWFVRSGEQVLFLAVIFSSSSPQNEKSASEMQNE